MNAEQPKIAVIIPVRNEVKHLACVLQDLQEQDWSYPFAVVVADGRSNDGTAALLELAAASSNKKYTLTVVDNPDLTTPHGLNRAVEAARDADYIIRVDGHARVPSNYVRLIVASLISGPADLVGPRIRLLPSAPGIVPNAIVDALSSPIGTGGTPSRGRVVTPRLTVHAPLSCWSRTWWDRLGGFDECLESNEDFDFDWRARRAGARVASLPAPVYDSFARASLLTLWQQRWRYGWWKSALIKKWPNSLQLRQILPPTAFVVFAVGASHWPTFVSLTVVYFCVCWFAASAQLVRRKATLPEWLAMPALSPMIFAIIHAGWVFGLLAGLVANGLPSAGARQTGARIAERMR